MIEHVQNWLRSEAAQARERSGVDIERLLMLSVGRVALKESASIGFDRSRYPSTHIRHIADWLVAAVLRSDDWLTRKDEQGRPLKLMKFGTIQQIVTEADKAMEKRRGDGAGLVTDEGTTIVFDCGDGWRIVKLETADALEHEGSSMGHCVGQGAYDDAVEARLISIFSLRDPKGKSRVTVEVDHSRNMVTQIKGRRNHMAKAEYLRRLAQWLDPLLLIDADELPPEFKVDRHRRLVDLTMLSRGDVYEGDLHLRSPEDAVEWRVPLNDGVVLNGNLSASGGDPLLTGVLTKIELPAGLVVKGKLSLDRFRIDSGDFSAVEAYFSACHVHGLPPTMDGRSAFISSKLHLEAAAIEFAEDVRLVDCRDTALGPDVRFRENLLIKSCRRAHPLSLASPVTLDCTEIDGTLRIHESDVKLEGGIRIGGDFKVESVSVVFAPERLVVGGCWTMDNSILEGRPKEAFVGGEIRHDGVSSAFPHDEATSASGLRF